MTTDDDLIDAIAEVEVLRDALRNVMQAKSLLYAKIVASQTLGEEETYE